NGESFIEWEARWKAPSGSQHPPFVKMRPRLPETGGDIGGAISRERVDNLAEELPLDCTPDDDPYETLLRGGVLFADVEVVETVATVDGSLNDALRRISRLEVAHTCDILVRRELGNIEVSHRRR